MVVLMFDWLTAGSMAPGVQTGSGNGLASVCRTWHWPACRCASSVTCRGELMACSLVEPDGAPAVPVGAVGAVEVVALPGVGVGDWALGVLACDPQAVSDSRARAARTARRAVRRLSPRRTPAVFRATSEVDGSYPRSPRDPDALRAADTPRSRPIAALAPPSRRPTQTVGRILRPWPGKCVEREVEKRTGRRQRGTGSSASSTST